jgi:thioredoxin-related protein
MTIDRRGLLFGAISGAIAFPGARAAEPAKEPEMTAEGLHYQPWFIESFLELPDDLAAANQNGKRFAIMWELRGCPYCRETHLVNFAQPRIVDYIKANFEVLQLNIIGDRKVKDFDGAELSEKALAAKYGVRFTPTLQFFGESLDVMKGLPPAKREVARAPGYLRPDDFLAFFHFVHQKAYEKGTFRDFLKARPS